MWHPTSARSATQCLAIATLGLLAGCNDHDDQCFYGCVNITPTEFSNGVVAGDFNGDGFTDVVALSTDSPPTGGNYPSSLKTYLSTSAGAFASPVLTLAGNNPLYLTSADLNGDGLLDVVSASFNDGALAVFINSQTTPGTFNPGVFLNSP